MKLSKILIFVCIFAAIITISVSVYSFMGINHTGEVARVINKVEVERCSKCGKILTFHDNDPNTKDIDVIAATFRIGIDPNSDSFFTAFVDKQVGNYKIGKTYNLCWECLFDVFFKKSSR